MSGLSAISIKWAYIFIILEFGSQIGNVCSGYYDYKKYKFHLKTNAQRNM